MQFKKIKNQTILSNIMHLTTSIAAFEAHFGEVCDPGSYSVSDFSFDSDLNILGCSSGAKFQWPLYNFSQISFYGCKVLYSMYDTVSQHQYPITLGANVWAT